MPEARPPAMAGSARCASPGMAGCCAGAADAEGSSSSCTEKLELDQFLECVLHCSGGRISHPHP
jgi:hypothetical protein